VVEIHLAYCTTEGQNFDGPAKPPVDGEEKDYGMDW
jgi:hypothetical protein